MIFFELALPLQYAFITCLGLVIGSFINSLTWRMHQTESIVSKRSICVHCAYQLAWSDIIPLASFIALKGRCRKCARPIPRHYPIIEFVTTLGFCASLFINQENVILLIRDLIFVSVLIALFITDTLYFNIPPLLIYFGCIIGTAINIFFLHYHSLTLLIGILSGGGFFAAQYVISNGRWIGIGDILMGTMMGLWLGFPRILVALLVSYILGALFAATLLLAKKKQLHSHIPFGTFLAIGTLTALWAGDEIIVWYLGLLK